MGEAVALDSSVGGLSGDCRAESVGCDAAVALSDRDDGIAAPRAGSARVVYSVLYRVLFAAVAALPTCQRARYGDPTADRVYGGDLPGVFQSGRAAQAAVPISADLLSQRRSQRSVYRLRRDLYRDLYRAELSAGVSASETINKAKRNCWKRNAK